MIYYSSASNSCCCGMTTQWTNERASEWAREGVRVTKAQYVYMYVSIRRYNLLVLHDIFAYSCGCCCWGCARLCFNFFTNYTHLPSKTHTLPFTQPFCSWMLLCCVCVCFCTLLYDANHHRLHTINDNNSISGSRSNEKGKPSRFVVSCLSCSTKKRTQHGDMFLWERVRSNKRNQRANASVCERSVYKRAAIRLIKHTSAMEKSVLLMLWLNSHG